MNYLRMDLKVCEGCGTLWLRVCLTNGVYCRDCSRKLAEFPAPREKRGRGKRSRLRRATGCGSGAVLTGGAR